MKKIISMLICIAVVLSLGAAVFAEENIKVVIDGKQVEFDVQPQLINDRTMVPMRKIFETLGAEVEWLGETQSIFATKNSLLIYMQIENPTFSVSDVITGESKKIELDAPPTIIDDRTLVPVRAISESLGYKVDWDGETQTVIIGNTPTETAEETNTEAAGE